MDTNKAIYWVALGVLALGLNHEYRQGNFLALHRLAGHTDGVFYQLSTRAERALALARMPGSDELPPASLSAPADEAVTAFDQAESARDQVREQAEQLRDRIRDQVRVKADIIRAEAEMRRAEVEQIRRQTRSQMALASRMNGQAIMVCPKTGIRVLLDGATVSVAPHVEVEDVDVQDNI